MSAASRARDQNRRFRHGFATLTEFRVWQKRELRFWQASVSTTLIAANLAILWFAMEDGHPIRAVEVPDDSPAFA